MINIAKRIAKQLIRDKRSLAMIILVPILLLFLLSVLLGENMNMPDTPVEVTIFDSIGFVLLGILAFFMIFLLSGISFVRERTSDTLERLMLTPVKTLSVVGGYVLGFGVFAVIQSTLMILFAKFVLEMSFAGNFLLAMFIMLLLAMSAVVTGILVSAVSKNEFQVVQFIPVIIIPQIFFTGIIPIDSLPTPLIYLSRIMPVYHGSLGLQGVMVYSYGISQLLPQIFILCTIILILFIANIIIIKKYRAV